MKLVLVLCAVLLVGANGCADVYWRDYEGKIPADAIPAGNHSDGTLSYIGQVYIHNYGFYFGSIIPGVKEVSVPCYGVKKADSIIKILCAEDKEKFYWMPTSHATYRKKDFTDKCPVTGAYDPAAASRVIPNGIMDLGRVYHSGRPIIGCAPYFLNEGSWFFYPDGDNEIRVDDWEALIYSDYPIVPPYN